jgi:hypothetical protein
MRKLFVIAGLTACSPTAYYVANVYQDNGRFFVEKCAIDKGRDADKPDPANCKILPVGELPPGQRAVEGIPEEGQAPMPPVAPAPPVPPAPPAAPPPTT